MDRSKAIFLYQTFRDQDSIFEIAAFPRKECHNDVLTKSQLTALRGGGVGNNIALLDPLPLHNRRTLIDTGALIGALILAQLVGANAASFFNRDGVARHRRYFTIGLSDYNLTRIQRSMIFHTRGNQWDFRADQWDSLCLHVRAHQGAVRIVV